MKIRSYIPYLRTSDSNIVILNATNLDFGTQTSATTRTFSVGNLGYTDATGVRFSISDPFYIDPTSTCGSTIAAGDTCFLRIQYRPSETGIFLSNSLLVDFGSPFTELTFNVKAFTP